MESNFIKGLEYKWVLVAKTPASQKFKVTIDSCKGLSAQVDVHYTRSKCAYGSVCFIGYELEFTDGLFHWVFFDLEKIVNKHGRYQGIYVSTAYVKEIIEGSFSFEKIKKEE